MAFTGFPRKVRFTPVPDPIFGALLEQIDDLGELKCTLRVIWLLHQKRGFPRYVTSVEVEADRVLARSLAAEDRDPVTEVRRSLELAVRRGTLAATSIERDGPAQHIYVLNREGDRKAVARLATKGVGIDEEAAEPAAPVPVERPNIFALYEDNVGMLSPLIADKLKEAEEAYPQEWIEVAFGEAVSNNKRSWSYIAAILERWDREGRHDGGTGRDSKKAGYGEYFRR